MTKEDDSTLYPALSTDSPTERRAFLRDGLTSTYVVPGDWVPQARTNAFVPTYASLPGRAGAATFLEGTTADEHYNEVRFYPENADAYRSIATAIQDAWELGDDGFVGHIGWTAYASTVLAEGLDYETFLRASAALPTPVTTRVLLWEGSPALLDDYNAASQVVQLVNTSLRSTGDVVAVADGQTRQNLGGYGIHMASHHQKLWIIRGSHGLFGFYGGCDIHPNRVRAVDWKSPWHDVHARVAGPAAERIAAIFLWRWLAAVDWGGAPLPTPWTDPDTYTGDVSDEARWQLRDTYRIYQKLRGYLGRPERERRHGSANPSRVYIGQTLGNPQLVAAGLQSCILTMVEIAISNARRFVYLEDQYFWHPEVAERLGRAVNSGMIKDLVILTQARSGLAENPEATRFGLQHLAYAARDRIDHVHVFERISKYVHSKTIIYDDIAVHTGSANFNRRGYQHDSESAGLAVDRIIGGVSWNNVYSSAARNLRARLWSKHLGVAPCHLYDGLGAMVYWRQAAARCIAAFPADPESGALIEGEDVVHVRLVQIDGQHWYDWARAQAGERPPAEITGVEIHGHTVDWLEDPPA